MSRDYRSLCLQGSGGGWKGGGMIRRVGRFGRRRKLRPDPGADVGAVGTTTADSAASRPQATLLPLWVEEGSYAIRRRVARAAGRMRGFTGDDRLAALAARMTPHPTSLRSATFSHKGRRVVEGGAGAEAAPLPFVIPGLSSFRATRSGDPEPIVILRLAQPDRGRRARARTCSSTISTAPARDSFLLTQAAGSPGLRREGAACRRMTKGQAVRRYVPRPLNASQPRSRST